MPKRASKPLTDRAVATAKATDRRIDLPDGIVPGLMIRITPQGTKTWALRYRASGKQERLKLGSYPALSVSKAREKAREALQRVQAGQRPVGASEATAGSLRTISDAWDAYMAAEVRPRQRSAQDRETTFTSVWKPAIGSKRPTDVSRSDIGGVIDGLRRQGKDARARNALAYVRPFFAWLVEREAIPFSPVDGIKPPRSVASRDRVLSLDELQRIWHAADAIGYPFGPATQLLILTGQRRDEIGGLEWAEIALSEALVTLPAERTKNAREHRFPLSDQACAILEGIEQIGVPMDPDRTGEPPRFVFTTNGRTPISGWSKAKERLDAKAAGLTPGGLPWNEAKALPAWRLHDIRRSVATGMVEHCGVSIAAVERLLNHVSGTFGGIVGVYQRAELWDEQLEAASAWAKSLVIAAE